MDEHYEKFKKNIGNNKEDLSKLDKYKVDCDKDPSTVGKLRNYIYKVDKNFYDLYFKAANPQPQIQIQPLTTPIASSMFTGVNIPPTAPPNPTPLIQSNKTLTQKDIDEKLFKSLHPIIRNTPGNKDIAIKNEALKDLQSGLIEFMDKVASDLVNLCQAEKSICKGSGLNHIILRGPTYCRKEIRQSETSLSKRDSHELKEDYSTSIIKEFDMQQKNRDFQEILEKHFSQRVHGSEEERTSKRGRRGNDQNEEVIKLILNNKGGKTKENEASRVSENEDFLHRQTSYASSHQMASINTQGKSLSKADQIKVKIKETNNFQVVRSKHIRFWLENNFQFKNSAFKNNLLF